MSKEQSSSVFFSNCSKWLLSWNCICKSPSPYTAMLQRPASSLLLSLFFVQLPFVTWRKGCQSHIFLFQATSSFVKQQDQQKNPFTLNTELREPFFWRKEKTILATMKLCLVLKDSKEDHKCTWGVSLMKDLIFSKKKNPFTFLRNGFLNVFWFRWNWTLKRWRKRPHKYTWDLEVCFQKLKKKSLSTLGTKHSWKLISCGNFSHGILFS